MSLRFLPILVAVVVTIATVVSPAAPVAASETRIIRFGYLDDPGSFLYRIAAAREHFREEGLRVKLVSFSDSREGLAALESGAIDIGAFRVGDSLRAIADGKGFRIIAGGGTPVSDDPLVELDDTLQDETRSRGVVVLIPPTWTNAEKDTLVRLTAALIKAYRSHRHQTPDASPGSHLNRITHFDPNPDYYRLERIWRSLGLQAVNMKQDFLANHIYEEIYCDALDRLLDSSADDPVFKELSSKAVCTPDCCPKNAKK